MVELHVMPYLGFVDYTIQSVQFTISALRPVADILFSYSKVELHLVANILRPRLCLSHPTPLLSFLIVYELLVLFAMGAGRQPSTIGCRRWEVALRPSSIDVCEGRKEDLQSDSNSKEAFSAGCGRASQGSSVILKS